MNTRKPVEFEHFEPGEAIKWINCLECGKRLQVFDKPIPDEMVFGSATDKPEKMTHSCIVSCRCKKTRVKVYGTIVQMLAYGCMAFPKPTPRSGREE
jgi:hypothetical protein